MTAQKKSLIEELYGPAKPQTHQSNNQKSTEPQVGGSGFSPEGGMFSGNPSEYAPIMEYVEPEVPPDVQQHVQPANPQFNPLPNIPLTLPTAPTPQVQPVKYANIPLSDLEIDAQEKTNIYSAIKWLAEWCLRQLKSIQYKDIHDLD